MTNSISLSDSVTNIKGVGSKKAERLGQMGILTVGDMLGHIPYKYKDKRSVTASGRFSEGTDILAEGRLILKRSRNISGGRSLIETKFEDSDGFFYVSFFNMRFLDKNLKTGEEYTLFGRMRYRNGMKVFTNPEITHTGSERDFRGIEPVYRCTSGVTSKDFIKWNGRALDDLEDPEWLSEELRYDRKLCDLGSAYRNIHFPKDNNWYRIALYRIVYDQLLTYQIALRKNRELITGTEVDTSISDVDISPFVSSLPFELTEGQKEAVRDIESDLTAPAPMNRLIQGDVGSGKTVVAEAAIYKTVRAGKQAAFMAPTEILARQHFKKLSGDLGKYGISVAVLTSGAKAAERRNLLENLARGDIDVLVGTHALIQDDVEFRDLALVITDEQHRFGVNQRKALVRKGAANVLVMSATPIPRTLAATVYGDMDFSVIRTMPAGRVPVITRTLSKSSRDKAYQTVLNELEHGNQGYVVAPAIENDEESEMTSAEALYQEMAKRFRGHNVAMIHGRLDKAEKEKIMTDFAEGKTDLLVSTVVIEVGIDVPDATVIVIENAERFGLAQLHQLRGRVGRSDKRSYCYLINHSEQETAAERMRIMCENSDGFAISEADYALRGAGDLMGTMQHGFGSGIVSLFRYEDILFKAAEDADRVMADPELADQKRIMELTEALYFNDNSNII